MKIIDITRRLDEDTPIYQGDPHFEQAELTSVQFNGYRVSKLRMGTHTGTHVDAPCHFIEGGKTAAEIPARRFIGPCTVSSDADKPVKRGCERIIYRFENKNTKLTVAQAERLVNSRVRLVGTDMLSIGNDEVHKILLGNECVILEAVDLARAEDKDYILSAAPLKMATDGSPVRACLIEREKGDE